jgi:ribose 5-phosphate isomerase B
MKAVAIGCDPNAAELKSLLIQHLQALGYEVEDYGADDPIYANVAFAVAEAVAAGKHDRGILICGTASHEPGRQQSPGRLRRPLRRAYSAERARKSNNANIMTLGAQTIDPELAKTLVSVWMAAEYEPGGRSEPKIQRIYQYAREHRT